MKNKVEARKLRPYFQSHPVTILKNQPIIDILCRVDTSRRMIKWGIELVEFGIEYAPRTTIKAQILADLMVECSFNRSSDPISNSLI
ncbi:hypothetical protein ES288_A06G156400v1 [Gossypium darwinii]|uniref:Uncharacterized protein n=1 Tax=Gossypium darwinii TaxID=34276 RepID=A0A5D2G668_GOSDA|nr:hypothetical protein ES288_A06G156400v1 [Gossypium darwinii]